MTYVFSFLGLMIIVINSAVFSPFFVLLRLLFNTCGFTKKLYCFLGEKLYFAWVYVNKVALVNLCGLNITYEAKNKISRNDWHIMISNHQGYFDILLLQVFCFDFKLDNKFLMKKSLIYLPFIGLGCWGLNFIFINRFTTKALKKSPKRITDQHAYIRNKCQLYKYKPTTIINFIEGTRNRPNKFRKSNYNNLLNPQPMGLSILISQMYPKSSKVIDVSLSYKKQSFLKTIFGSNNSINISFRVVPIEARHAGDYRNDKEYRVFFNNWLKKIWLEKDKSFKIPEN